MLRRRLYTALIAAVLVGIAAWWVTQLSTSSSPNISKKPTQVAASSCGLPAAMTVPAVKRMTVTNNATSATAVEVKVGQTVLWANQTDQPVALRSVAQNGQGTCAGFNSPVLAANHEFRFTFLRSGRWYFQINNRSTEQIVVTD